MRSRFLLELRCVKGQITHYGAYHHAMSSGEDQQTISGIASNSHVKAGVRVLFLSVSYEETCLGWSAVEYYIWLNSSGGGVTS
jgi:hypothetical protein